MLTYSARLFPFLILCFTPKTILHYIVAIACPLSLFLIISKFPNNTREINNYKQPKNLSFWFAVNHIKADHKIILGSWGNLCQPILPYCCNCSCISQHRGKGVTSSGLICSLLERADLSTEG
jgi:hypothetical protein